MHTTRTQLTHPTTLAAIAASLACLSIAHATDRLVPSQYPTIQAAINAAQTGDTVTVSPGLYREAIELTKSITLQGDPSAEVADVVLTGTGVVGGAMLLGYTGSSYNGPVTIRHLTVDGQGVEEGTEDAGIAVYPLGAANSLLIEGCIFQDLHNGYSDGGALWIATQSVVVRDCSFLRNRSTAHGAAIFAAHVENVTLAPIVERCVFRDHTFGTGTFRAEYDTHLVVRECVIGNSNWLCANWQFGTVTFTNNIGCSIGALSNGGYVDGGNNNWAGPCPDCDSNGKLDLEEILFGGADCNGNDLLDACEVVDNPKLDGNGDGLIDECQCLADVTGNGSVDAIDLAALMSSWGGDGSGEFDADVTNDGMVNGLDLAVILDGWGACP